MIDRIRQLYKIREGSVLPVPWCEDFSFHLDELFTRLRIINKEKTRGTLSEEITNMTAIFKAHEECLKPRTVLIEGDPGMGKTTYCQKLAYDWANRQGEWDESFPEIELLLLLRCHDIESNIREAIEEQILPEDIDKESKENFFKFIRENQSKVLLVLDGLDEVDPSKVAMYLKLAEGREFSKCRIVLTSRHEVGMKFRPYCDTLWEIVGFTEKDAESFIFKYFKNNLPLARKLLEQLQPWSGARDLRQMMSNPLNTTLFCLLCEDFNGSFPTSRTQLYIEIVLCVLRRYEEKNKLWSANDDLIKVYEKELLHLGHMAFKSLCEGELYIEERKLDCSSTVLNLLTKFGFLSIQITQGSRRKRCVRYGFLHKSFQEFFSGFYLATNILSGELDCDTVVTDGRYFNELKQAFLFMSGIVVSRCEETAVCLVKTIAAHINGESQLTRNLEFAFDCIEECASHKKNVQSQLLHTFGFHLDITTLQLTRYTSFNFEYFYEALTVNTTLINLHLRDAIGDSAAASLSNAIKVNTVLTNLVLRGNSIGASCAASLSDAIKVNTALTNLDLSYNDIGVSGAASLSDAIKVNTVLTTLVLRGNSIGASCAASLSDAIKVNTALTNLDLSYNEIGASGAASLSDAIKVNTVLTNLFLRDNSIGASCAASLSDAIKVNTALTNLDLSINEIGASGAASLSDAIKVNTALTNLNLRSNDIGASGAASLSDAIKVNTALTNLDLSVNEIGYSGAASLSDAIKVNTVLTNLDLSNNLIGNSGAASLSDAIKVNTVLTNLNLSVNDISASGAASLSDGIKVNTVLTYLDLGFNKIGDSGAGSLSKAIKVNTTLTNLDLSGNSFGTSGAASLSDAIKVNTVLTNLDLTNNKIGDSGAASLSDAIKVNTVLTNLFLSGNSIGASGAASLSDAIKVNTVLTNLNLSVNDISASGAASLSDAIKVSTVLTKLDLGFNKIGDSGAGSLSDAIKVNTALTNLNLSRNNIGDSGAGSLSDAIKVNTALTNLDLSNNKIGASGAASLSDAIKVNTALTNLDLS